MGARQDMAGMVLCGCDFAKEFPLGRFIDLCRQYRWHLGVCVVSKKEKKKKNTQASLALSRSPLSLLKYFPKREYKHRADNVLHFKSPFDLIGCIVCFGVPKLGLFCWDVAPSDQPVCIGCSSYDEPNHPPLCAKKDGKKAMICDPQSPEMPLLHGPLHFVALLLNKLCHLHANSCLFFYLFFFHEKNAVYI